jgi:hypothetical protein
MQSADSLVISLTMRRTQLVYRHCHTGDHAQEVLLIDDILQQKFKSNQEHQVYFYCVPMILIRLKTSSVIRLFSPSLLQHAHMVNQDQHAHAVSATVVIAFDRFPNPNSTLLLAKKSASNQRRHELHAGPLATSRPKAGWRPRMPW